MARKRGAGAGRPRQRVRQLVPDDLWRAVQPLLPEEAPKPRGGRPRVPDRTALAGLIFVMRNGLSWTRLPLGLGFGSGMTCWRRLREWQACGAWPAIRRELSRRLEDGTRIDWRRVEGEWDGFRLPAAASYAAAEEAAA